jgi:hypothetical protein
VAKADLIRSPGEWHALGGEALFLPVADEHALGAVALVEGLLAHSVPINTRGRAATYQ